MTLRQQDPNTRTDRLAEARRIAREVASRHAADVDLKARFPAETVQALKDAGLLSAAVPAALGGGGCGLSELAGICSAVAQSCGASGMTLAMHYIQVACLARHGQTSPFFRDYLAELVQKQLLIASVTSEVGTGGDTRRSLCAANVGAEHYELAKDATTVSYGAHADALLLTCRRAADSAESDQILVLARKGEYTLTQSSTWDPLGMRGTCSPGFKVQCRGASAQVVPGAFADASARTMVPYSHVLWSSVWHGIAADAVARAGTFVRNEARRNPGHLPPMATPLAQASSLLQSMRNNWVAIAAEFDALGGSADEMETLSTLGWALKLNHLKVSSSELAPQIVHRALQIIGILGYKNDSPFSVGRHYRDVLSASLMIANDRIASKSASMLMVFKDD